MLFSRKAEDRRHRAYVWRNNLLVRVNAYGVELDNVAMVGRLVADGPFFVWWQHQGADGPPDPLHTTDAAEARRAVDVICTLEDRL